MTCPCSALDTMKARIRGSLFPVPLPTVPQLVAGLGEGDISSPALSPIVECVVAAPGQWWQGDPQPQKQPGETGPVPGPQERG